MKYLEKFKHKWKMVVQDVIDEYGEEIAAEYLNVLFIDQYIEIEKGFNVYNSMKTFCGIVEKIFYINSSGFTVVRLLDDEDVIIGRATIHYTDINLEEGELFIDTKKYNL